MTRLAAELMTPSATGPVTSAGHGRRPAADHRAGTGDVVRRPTTAVVVVTHDTCEEALACLASLEGSGVDQTVVVDSGSHDGTAQAVRAAAPDARVLALRNVGFGRAANAGIRATRAQVVIVCNADVRFGPEAVHVLAARLARDPGLGALGPRVRYPDGSVQASARRIPGVGTAIGHALLGRLAPQNPATRRYHDLGRADLAHEVDWLSGCALALRREAVDDIGGFDPGYFLYVEDVDLGQRLRDAGWRLGLEPDAEVIHLVGASTSQHRLRALIEHARSLDRYVRQRAGAVWGVLLTVPLRVALAGWVAVTYVAELVLRRSRSTTGERIGPTH